jgi:hypothetical protein
VDGRLHRIDAQIAKLEEQERRLAKAKKPTTLEQLRLLGLRCDLASYRRNRATQRLGPLSTSRKPSGGWSTLGRAGQGERQALRALERAEQRRRDGDAELAPRSCARPHAGLFPLLGAGCRAPARAGVSPVEAGAWTSSTASCQSVYMNHVLGVCLCTDPKPGARRGRSWQRPVSACRRVLARASCDIVYSASPTASKASALSRKPSTRTMKPSRTA